MLLNHPSLQSFLYLQYVFLFLVKFSTNILYRFCQIYMLLNHPILQLCLYQTNLLLQITNLLLHLNLHVGVGLLNHLIVTGQFTT